MNETDRLAAVHRYLDEVTEQFYSGHAIEHAYRPALKALMSSFDDTIAVNDPKHSEHGAPDFIFLKKSNTKIIKGYAEAKDITVSLDKTEKTNQMERYAGYANLFLTDYLEFRFFKNGEKYQTISLGYVKDGKLYKTPENGEMLARELQAFLELPPEKIRSGKRLAEIMGGKARRIRDNVTQYLGQEESEQNGELEKIYGLMKTLLVHDLTREQFADLYAQTLVYGLFAARYGDDTPENFTRAEARDLVPASNPFLRHFFDHIAGPNFDTRLGYIVDELCEIFAISDVRSLISHLATKFAFDNEQDLTIHFYEDFLKEYDPAMRRKMGVYYTPLPVVRYIVRSVDKVLKEEFGITKGLASDETIDHWVEAGQDLRLDRREKRQTGYNIKLPRVQVLDPSVGTATFLNETIKFIYESFKGQEGRWPGYVNDNLLKRLYGFELMMAPYTIAHLKLGMTFKDTGVEKLASRLNVFLTNTLEEGIPQQPDLFSFGLAEAVSEESRLAAEVKSEKPVMVVMGNPPYSVSSNNKSKWIQNLIADYKKDLNERKINLDDDYIKFIRFAEEMIARNGSGIVAMITNNSYIDGITHRQMRKHLLQTFDKIYVLDLHGSSIKLETAPDGGKDENVFDIQQGVSIIMMAKSGVKQALSLGEVYHSGIFGKRKVKFTALDEGKLAFRKISALSPNYFFVPKDFALQEEYSEGVKVSELFIDNNTGIQTKKDKLAIAFTKSELEKNIDYILNNDIEEARSHFQLGDDGRDWTVKTAAEDVRSSQYQLKKVFYRPFDFRYIYYSGRTKGLVAYPRHSTSKNMLKENVALITLRLNGENEKYVSIVTDKLVEKGSLASGNYSFFPLYLYHEDGTRTPNFAPAELSALTRQLTSESSPEDILDYIYAVLHSPSYREKYKEFLKIDFPRVPVPTQADFDRLVPLGRSLRELHLMKSPLLDDYITTYPEPGDDIVEKPRFEPDTTSGVGAATSSVSGRVYINDTQYFGNVPETAWNFYIGGYQPAQKWLKDRKGRQLTSDDLDHYQKIIKILVETDRLMKEIG